MSTTLPELPEPVHIDRIGFDHDTAYTVEQVRAIQLAAWKAAIEAAAAECERHTTHPEDPSNEVWQCAYNHVAGECANAIRSLPLPESDMTQARGE